MPARMLPATQALYLVVGLDLVGVAEVGVAEGGGAVDVVGAVASMPPANPAGCALDMDRPGASRCTLLLMLPMLPMLLRLPRSRR